MPERPNGTQFSVAVGNQPAPPQAGQITLDRLQAESANGQPYTAAEGSIGSGVSRSTLTLSDGSQVVTTVGNGLFPAWRPGSATVTSATVTSASGRQPGESPRRRGIPVGPRRCQAAAACRIPRHNEQNSGASAYSCALRTSTHPAAGPPPSRARRSAHIGLADWRAKANDVAVRVDEGAFVLPPFGVLGRVHVGAR